MYVAIAVCAVTCAVMIAAVLFFPKLKIGRITLDTYWLVTIAGALSMIAFGKAEFAEIGSALTADTSVNPLKILILFLSMTVLSVFLDELGFFRFLASIALKKARSGQKKLFLYLYITVSILTVFTSNDVIILSFTPFICYFAKNAHIDPIPYLAAEFVAANTWSMMLVIGNPTNIYLASAYGIDFAEYLAVSILPTFLAGTTALCMLWLLFRKKLALPIEGEADEVKIGDRFLLWIGIVHIALCTLLLAIGSYIGVDMWIVALSSVVSLFIFVLITAAIRRERPKALLGCLRRAPYQLIPFVLGMFVMIVGLNETGVTAAAARLLGANFPILEYGIASFLAANLINNIPMSVLFSSMIAVAPTNGSFATYATIIGSNIGAFFTPIGALAGIMWSSILHDHGLKFAYHDFLKLGVTVAVPSLLAALAGLYLALL